MCEFVEARELKSSSDLDKGDRLLKRAAGQRRATLLKINLRLAYTESGFWPGFQSAPQSPPVLRASRTRRVSSTLLPMLRL